ncbi:hypothetical protein J2X76_003622 [Neorhizobium sp. 2083]|uniref:hypothetical protein n=1 Tax=Neorhizobium sp. 2083 TaxID=2817762 RepID=UPI00285D99CC|nr:hypothetical protein [Neorhizobium sp. 2083]MDR6818445.1 hypothetical protein [Neorhizobium sp. 2083]
MTKTENIPPQTNVRVKPLEWRKGYCDEAVIIEQASFGGLYQVRQFGGGLWLDYPYASAVEFGTVDAAKAAAQADYERRVMALLDAASLPILVGEVPVNACIAKLTWMLTTTGRDWRSGQEFITAAHSQEVIDTLREALRLLQAMRTDPANPLSVGGAEDAFKAWWLSLPVKPSMIMPAKDGFCAGFAAAIDASPASISVGQPFAWYWHDATGALWITGDGRKPDVPAEAKPLYEHPQANDLSAGWVKGIETAPYATTVLGTYFDGDVGEWIVQLFVGDRPAAPFTHWMLVTRPDEAPPAEPNVPVDRDDLACKIQGIFSSNLSIDEDYDIIGTGPASYKVADLILSLTSPQPKTVVVWTSQYQLDEALNCGIGYIYGAEGKPEKADIPLMRLADGGPAPSDNRPLFGELPSPSPFTRKLGHSAADLVAKIAQVSTAVGFQANEPAMEMAGQIVSILAANPEHIERFMSEGSELFLDGTFNHENGSLTYRAINGSILSPSVLREKKGQQQ